MTPHDPGDQDYGRLERPDGQVLVRYTRRFAHPPQSVWRALTEPEELAAWFPTTIEGDRTAGAPLRFSFKEVEMPPMAGEMLAFEPPTLLELRWGDDLLRFELRPDGDGSVLELTVTFEEIGKVARDGAGWHVCLDELRHHLDGTAPPWSTDNRWREVHPAYTERFGPEASTMGPPEEWEQTYGPA
jgi:uncharacterized protein YndB with AHSA1/START domain